MQNDLALFFEPNRPNRALVAQGRGIYNNVRLAAWAADGAMALGAHIMEGATQLDAHRIALAGDNPQLNAILCGIEIDTIRQAQGIQRRTFNQFSL